MHPTLLDHRHPIQDSSHTLIVERVAAPLRALHSDKGQQFLVAGVRHMTAEKAWKTLRGIDRDPCGGPHHMPTPRGQNARCDTRKQQNTLSCAHGSQLPLQQSLVAAVLLGVISPEVLSNYVAIRRVQKQAILDADDLLTRGYAIAARGKTDESSQAHLRLMGLPVVSVTTADVNEWMCGKQETNTAPLIPIIDATIAALEQRYPALLAEALPGCSG